MTASPESSSSATPFPTAILRSRT
uniref:Dmt101 n=1 Tax=Arundo donax TaxID=35708 RepID=A0A0A9GAH1_ARUDO